MVGQLQLLFAANGDVNDVNRHELHKALDEARTIWAKNRLDAYSFTFYEVNGDSAPEHPHPVTVTVQDGQLASIVYAQSGEQVPADDRTNIPISIDAMLDRINKEIDENVASFEAHYHENGAPTKFCETKILPHGRTDMDCTHISNVNALIA